MNKNFVFEVKSEHFKSDGILNNTQFLHTGQ